ncbi:DMSO/selenate family reductase complex A subunit [Curtanaerobium respiraculi]|uniref:DMSO/selenate family reductase complex A subunit n=1 Tax=Curtanaerobium respiraculi TaxID=2949669 RepID=UPI0024B32041|nr:DMSO/selenate family reductase complex A subunit [Curtanaerobium respiraculi]
MDETMLTTDVSRRTFLKGGAAATAALAAGGVLLDTMFDKVEPAYGSEMNQESSEEKVVQSHCSCNCASRCPLWMHVKDDEIQWIQSETKAWDDDETSKQRACLRGRSVRRWINDPDRLKYPMKRVGKRGDGEFERISWDEAITTINDALQRTYKNYGPEAVYWTLGSGVYSLTGRPIGRWLATTGGYLSYYGTYSAAQSTFIAPYMWGANTGSTPAAIIDSDLVILAGWAPSDSMMGSTGEAKHGWNWARRMNPDAKYIHIDPRMSDTKCNNDDEWLPIRPGTDAALVAAIAHVLIEENLVARDFLHTYCIGFDEETMPEAYKGKNMSYEAYVMGTGYDMVKKTPAWAEPITLIPAERIIQLAHELADAKAPFVGQYLGVQRHSNGELNYLAYSLLPLMVGALGKPGTSSGLSVGSYSFTIPWISGTNPCKSKISIFSWADAIDHGHEMTALHDGVQGTDKLSTDIKFLVEYGGNCFTNQHSQSNRAHDILVDESKCEFILVFETLMNDAAKYADILLPDIMRAEQKGIINDGWSGDVASITFADAATTGEKFERRSSFDVCADLCEAAGKRDEYLDGKDQEGWTRQIYEAAAAKDPRMPSYEEGYKVGEFHYRDPQGYTPAFKAFVNDPVANPLKTPSGKIEIFSEKLQTTIVEKWQFDDPRDVVAAIPLYTPGMDSYEDCTDEYPFTLIGFHYKARTHTNWGNVEVLKQATPQEVWINTMDAKKLGIENGETVSVFSEFGEMYIQAKVTPRIIPGSLAIPQGAWRDADMHGDRIDHGGCINTLTRDHPSPFAKGNPQHSNVAGVRKIS